MLTTTDRFSLLLFLCGTATIFGDDVGPKLTIGDLGELIGVREYTEWSNRSVDSFLGIPYAEPPIGELRYRPPVKIASWNGTLNATSYGSACPQKSALYSEDCLTLNVFVPKRDNYDESDRALLPVMIFIHGGTFRTGRASLYSPLRFLDEKDLIVVVPQYRLGFLGLFSLQTDDVPGNVQFLDQIMAMRWVQDNIIHFGGDKSKVTLYGHSSGAASVHFHLLSPLTKGLFHRTILQSGSALRTYGVDENPRESASILAAYCGCTNATVSSDIANCMREMSVENIVDCTSDYLDETIYEGLTRAIGHMAVVQTAGVEKFLTESPKDLVTRGEFLRLPMMGGVTRNDGATYLRSIYDEILLPNGWAEDEDYARNNLTGYVLKYLGIKDVTSTIEDAMTKIYFEDNEIGDLVSMARGLIDICTMVSYKSGSYETLRANMISQDTYIYTFNYPVYTPTTNGTTIYPFETGPSHGDDVRLLFPMEDYHREIDQDMAKLLLELWTSFVIDGVPKANGVTWPAMSTSVGPYLAIDSEISLGDNFLNEFITGGATSSSFNNFLKFLLIATTIIGNKLLP